jgi:DNA repair photolyase
MIMKPIYAPKGAAKEYGDLACNIYTGCNHGCAYCFAPSVLRKDREAFHSCAVPRADIVESVKRQLDQERITGKLIHLCFSCDPYPAEIDTTPTREIIKAIKNGGNHVQILTKGGFRAERDFDLLDGEDWFGVTISGGWPTAELEPKAATPEQRLWSLAAAKDAGSKTWVSCEPVIHPDAIFALIMEHGDYIDAYKIGKLNYHKPEEYGEPPIDWGEFGREVERLCRKHGRNYYIKEALRLEMNGKQSIGGKTYTFKANGVWVS